MNISSDISPVTKSKKKTKWIDPIEMCPVCSINGINRQLKLYQINLEEAVFLCPLSDCIYPGDNDWRVIPRTLDDLDPDSDTDSESTIDEQFTTSSEPVKTLFQNTSDIDMILSPQSNTDRVQDILNELRSDFGLKESNTDNCISDLDFQKLVDDIENCYYPSGTVDDISNDFLENLGNLGLNAKTGEGDVETEKKFKTIMIQEKTETLKTERMSGTLATENFKTVINDFKNDSQLQLNSSKIKIISEEIIPGNTLCVDNINNPNGLKYNIKIEMNGAFKVEMDDSKLLVQPEHIESRLPNVDKINSEFNNENILYGTVASSIKLKPELPIKSPVSKAPLAPIVDGITINCGDHIKIVPISDIPIVFEKQLPPPSEGNVKCEIGTNCNTKMLPKTPKKNATPTRILTKIPSRHCSPKTPVLNNSFNLSDALEQELLPQKVLNTFSSIINDAPLGEDANYEIRIYNNMNVNEVLTLAQNNAENGRLTNKIQTRKQTTAKNTKTRIPTKTKKAQNSSENEVVQTKQAVKKSTGKKIGPLKTPKVSSKPKGKLTALEKALECRKNLSGDLLEKIENLKKRRGRR